MNDNLKKKTIKNIGYNALTKMIPMLFKAATNIVPSRCSPASDYGFVGFAGIIASFLGQFNDLGINNGIIQMREVDECIMNNAFSMIIFLGVVLFVVSFLIALIALLFFDNKAVVGVIRISSFNFLNDCFAF